MRAGGTMAALSFLGALLSPAGGRADVVAPPPTDCPAGSEGGSCHGGTFCSPVRCTDSTACPNGTSCQQANLCIAQFTCWGKGGPSTPMDDVKGSCATGSCAAGTCQSISACVSSTSTTPNRGCACSLGEAGAGGGAAFLGVLVFAALALARTRRRSGA
jgi:MYXO-CTERM domain-containing protein